MKRNSPLASFRCKQYPAFRRTESFEFSNSQIASLVFVIYRLFRDRTTFERYNTIRYCVNKLTWNARRSSDEKWPKKILWRSRTGQTAFENSVEKKVVVEGNFHWRVQTSATMHWRGGGDRDCAYISFRWSGCESLSFSFFLPSVFFPLFFFFFLFTLPRVLP